MNFVITNMTGFRNKGCEAMTKVITAEIANRFPDAKFRVFSNDPGYDELWAPTNQEVSFVATPSVAPHLLISLYRFMKEVTGGGKVATRVTRESFAWARAIISTGGDVFSSEYGGLKRHLAPIRAATRLRKLTILLAHSIGPFKTKEEREIFIRAMQGVPLITTRETLSLEYVRQLGLKNTRVELTADPAFCSPAADSATVDKLWQTYHLPDDCPVIGIAASQGIAHYAKASYEAHFEALKELIHHLAQELGFHVILIPHVQERYVGNDDRLLCSGLYRCLGFPRNVTVISLDHSAEEIKGIIDRCDLLVAERMHAAIAGLSQSVPTLVVGYSVKARGILGDIFGQDAWEEYLISVNEMSASLSIHKIHPLLDRRQKVSDFLDHRIPDIVRRAEKNFDLVVEILT